MAQQHRILALVAFVAFLGVGCIALPSFSAPKSTPPGSPNFVFGITQVPEGDGAIPMVGLRYGLMPRVDIGADVDPLIQRVDARVQLIGKPLPLDLDVEAGVGVLLVLPFRYVGFGVGIDTPAFAPYVRYRYYGIGDDSTDDVNDDDDVDLDLGIWWAQLTVGAELRMNNGMALIPEYSRTYNLENEDGRALDSISVGLRFGRF